MSATELEKITVKLNLGFLNVEGTWSPTQKEKEAAWELYVELITRISVVELGKDDGLLREALSSLYTFFKNTREILRKYGAEVVRGNEADSLSMGIIAVAMVNLVIRPVLSKWHPLLLDYESKKKENVTPFEHEHMWEKNAALRSTLENTRLTLIQYANVLAKIANVPLLVFDSKNRSINIPKPIQIENKLHIDLKA